MKNNIQLPLLLMIGGHVCVAFVTYSPNMCGPRVCCTGYILSLGRCKECPPGTHLENCTQSCLDGFYGRLCRERCPTQCNETCDKTSGNCPGMGSYLERQIMKFVVGNIWLFIGAATVFVLCSCVCSIIFYKICSKDKERVNVSSSNKNPQQSNGMMHEIDEASSKNSTSVEPPPPVLENNKPVTQEKVEYSKAKKRNSRTRKHAASQEMTSYPEYSDDSDDIFDSDQSEDSLEVFDKVQISDLPNTLQPGQQSVQNPNEAYGSIWL